jgi:molecular chaperone DnaJ
MDARRKKGVAGVVKGWLRRQLDEELQLTLPAARLVPGRHIPLRIRQGISDEVQTVEITLPPDFTAGKPVRLRGLGRRVGPWQGDLYLTLYNE